MTGRRSAARIALSCVAALALLGCHSSSSTSTTPPTTTYALGVTRSGSGSVTSSPPGITCGTACTATFAAGTAVTLTAVPAAGNDFSGWSGAGISCPGTGTCTVSMTGPRSVTATFSPSGASTYALNVTKTGSGTVTSTPAGIDCGSTCSATFDAGTVVSLAASAASGYSFAGWTGNGITCPGTGACAVSMTATRNVMAMFQSTSGGDDLCNGLVTDKLAHPQTALAKPALGQAYVDPQFGTTIRRISNALSTGCNVAKPVYSTIQAWNADESYLILYHTDGSGAGHYLYQGKAPYNRIKLLDIRPADLEQVYWDPVDPKILYYTDIVTHQLHRFNVDTDTHDTSTVVRDFSLAPVNCADDITGGTDPMWTSWDGKFFGYTCGRAAGAKMFTYDKSTNTVGTIFVGNSGGNAPEPAPSGALFFLNMNDTVAQVRDANMNLLRTMAVIPAEHATLGTSDGVDTHFSIQFDTTPAGNVIAVNMTNAQKWTIIGPATGWPDPVRGTHLSGVAYKRPGWIVMDAVGEANGQTVLDGEVVLVNANTGGSICRVGHHRSCGSSGNCGTQGYWAEPHATISPTGTRILFGIDWGGGTTVDSYVIELPGYHP